MNAKLINKIINILSRQYGRETAEDATQDAVVRLLERGTDPDDVSAYLFTASRNAAKNLISRASERRHCSIGSYDASSPATSDVTIRYERDLLIHEVAAIDRRIWYDSLPDSTRDSRRDGPYSGSAGRELLLADKRVLRDLREVISVER